MTFDVGTFGAFVAGLLSFLSPCILPIVPFYLCYLAGVTVEGVAAHPSARTRRRLVVASVGFALGVATVFIALGASATLVGQALRDWFDTLRWVAAAIMLALGLHFLGLFRIGLLFREARFHAPAPAGPAGAYVTGLAFAFGWTPCVGPVLAAILFSAAAQETASEGMWLLFAYAVGMTLPFVVVAFFAGRFLGWTRAVRRYLGAMEKAIGGALVAFAALIASDSMYVISSWMLSIAPDIGTLR